LDASELTPLGDNREIDRPAATMTFYSPVHGATGKVRYVSITLPYIAAIADDPHYQPPPLPEQ
jgi:hypothetical protein